MSDFFDKCGITVSSLCGIHCSALVVLSLAQPLVVAGTQHAPWLRSLELALAALAIVFALLSFVSGYRHHGHAKPVALGAIGLGLVVAAIATSIHETPWAPVVTFLGGAALIIGHRWNIRCRCSHAQAKASLVAKEETPT